MADPHRQVWSSKVQTINTSKDKSFGRFGKLSESLHTDGPGWPRPNDATCLYCKCAPTQREGLSRLLGIERLKDNIRSRFGNDALRFLCEFQFPWRIEDDLGGGVAWEPILKENALRWMSYTIDEGYRKASVAITREASEALDIMESLNHVGDDLIEFKLDPEIC